MSVKPSTPIDSIPIGFQQNLSLPILAPKISLVLGILSYVPFVWFLFRIAQSKRGDRISVSHYFEISNFKISLILQYSDCNLQQNIFVLLKFFYFKIPMLF
jgi:hypothetical protein